MPLYNRVFLNMFFRKRFFLSWISTQIFINTILTRVLSQACMISRVLLILFGSTSFALVLGFNATNLVLGTNILARILILYGLAGLDGLPFHVSLKTNWR